MDETLKAEVAALIAESIKPFMLQVGELTKAVEPVAVLQSKLDELQANVSTVADTIKDLPPAGVDLDKRISDGVAAVLAARDASAAKTGERQKLIDKVIGEKLGGDKELADYLVGEDEAAIAASAEKLAVKLKTIKPDFGGAANNGGTPPGNAAPVAFANLPKGTAEYAATAIKPQA